MLRLNLKSVLKSHKILFFAIISLIVLAVLSLNFSLFQFREIQRSYAVNTNSSTYKVNFKSISAESEQIKKVFSEYSKNLKAGYITKDGKTSDYDNKWKFDMKYPDNIM